MATEVVGVFGVVGAGQDPFMFLLFPCVPVEVQDRIERISTCF